MIHVYGVVDGLDEVPPIAGVEDAPLERRRVAGLDLVLSRSATPPSAEVSRETVLRHAQVVEALTRRSAAILPAQLGRGFRDEDQLASAVAEQAAQLERGLERVRGCVEFGLRATTELPPAPEADTGSAYMQARLDQVRLQDDLVERLHEPLARLARETTLQRRGGGVTAAYLVERDEVPAFEAEAARLEHADGVTVVCTGPWPPYSFAAGTP
ncbi:MAG TPA: GvpL/GvpF family gas vesicle protein [Gaiellaceae bacterium]|nr:GvpL/GvpF family gas vesicle protein [Gaiellaceae bacterium]